MTSLPVSIPKPTSTITIPSKLGPLLTLVYSDLSVFTDKLAFYKAYIKEYTQAAFNDTQTPDEFHTEHMFHSEIIWFVAVPECKTEQVALAQGKFIAHSSFSPMEYNGVEVLYHNGCIVDPKYEGNGIFSAITKQGMVSYGGDYYTCRTQNPAVIRGLQRSFGEENVYTDILWRDTDKATQQDFQKQLDLVRGMGKMVSQYLNMDKCYDKNTMIAKSVYGKTLFHSLARKQYDGEVGERVDKYLDRAEGDCLLIFAAIQEDENDKEQ